MLSPKEEFNNKLNLEVITDGEYEHAQKVWNTFNINNMGEYHDLYVQSDTLLLADVFKNFRNICLKIYQLDPAHFVSGPGNSWKACLKKTNAKLDLLTDVNMLLMFEQRTRGGICQSTHRYFEANNKYMKDYNPDIESSFLEYLDSNNLYGWSMSKKLPIGEFKWSENLSRYTEKYIKNYNEDSDYGISS